MTSSSKTSPETLAALKAAFDEDVSDEVDEELESLPLAPKIPTDEGEKTALFLKRREGGVDQESDATESD